MAPHTQRVRRAARGAVLTMAVPIVLLATPVAPPLLFAAVAPQRLPGSEAALCGSAQAKRSPAASAAAVATLNPLKWGGAPPAPSEKLRAREWARMYRTLGLEPDVPKDRLMKAVSKLRKKYADNEEALERVENANLWIMTKLLSQTENTLRKQQQANRLRELGDSPRKLFQKYVAGYIPPNIRQLFEAPTTKHFRIASGLIGIFALMGLVVPTQVSNFVALSAAATMGLVYQRNRPEPVKDEFGNVGRNKKINYKEMGATIAITFLGAALGMGFAVSLSYVTGAPVEGIFGISTCFVLWMASLFFKVYGCFDPED